ncbi:MAG TPA: outer membrane protein transport protein, partial [Tichowtungia sp.]|nr:outer membrane protein transport protein [Tichowtungia sp.]
YPTPPLPNPETTPKNWKDVWSIRAGGEYELNESWVVRGGYVWDESPVDDQSRAPELPGSSRHMLMTGLGWKGEQLGVDLAYSFLWAEDATTGANVVAATGGATAGSYSTETHLIALSLSYEF